MAVSSDQSPELTRQALGGADKVGRPLHRIPGRSDYLIREARYLNDVSGVSARLTPFEALDTEGLLSSRDPHAIPHAWETAKTVDVPFVLPLTNKSEGKLAINAAARSNRN